MQFFRSSLWRTKQEIGGYEATKQIREFNKEVVIIAQTAYGLTGDREKAIEAGCSPVLCIGTPCLDFHLE